MGISSAVIKFSCILFLAYNLSTCHAETCATPTGVICLDQTSYVNCENSAPVLTAPVTACDTDTLCYGTAATSAEICKSAPCTNVVQSYRLTGAPDNVYYTCFSSTERYMRTCSSGSFNATSGTCNVVAAVTTTTPTIAPRTTVRTNPPCNGNKRIEDPLSCNHYYMCNILGGGTSRRMRCPFRMRFNSNLGKCGARFLTACGNRPENV